MNLLAEDFDVQRALSREPQVGDRVRLKRLPQGHSSYRSWHNSLTSQVCWTGHMDRFRDEPLTVHALRSGHGTVVHCRDDDGHNWYIHPDMLELA